MKKRVKVAVTGAAGQIGYSLLFRLCQGDAFGQDTEIELNLLELPQAQNALKGVAMELEDCAFPLLKKVTCTADLSEAFQDVNWCLLVGSVPRKAGMERSDLLNINGSIFREQGKIISKVAAKDVRIFVVGNPCNTNALIAMNNAPAIPKDRFFAMTMLDQNRAQAQLTLKAQVDIIEVKNMAIWGNHSSTQFPDFFHTEIKGKAATQVLDENWLKTHFIQTVQQRGAEVIKARGASSAASAANAVIDSLKNLSTSDSDEIFSVGLCSQGQYGVDEGLIFSYPCRMKKGKPEIVMGIKHDSFAQEKFNLTLKELQEERDTVKKLNII